MYEGWHPGVAKSCLTISATSTVPAPQIPMISERPPQADMDALPILEIPSPDTLPFVSQHPGAMHACGHDGHTAILLGAARLLKKREADLRGTVRLLFQPAEEGGAGGLRMLQVLLFGCEWGGG